MGVRVLEQRLLLRVYREVSCLLLKLALYRQRDRLAAVYHPSWQRPVSRILALDRHHLQLVGPARIEASDDWVRRVVRAPLPQKATAVHARPSARVGGRGATRGETDVPLKGPSAGPVDGRVGRVRCASKLSRPLRHKKVGAGLRESCGQGESMGGGRGGGGTPGSAHPPGFKVTSFATTAG